jgi:hypothetical protein
MLRLPILCLPLSGRKELIPNSLNINNALFSARHSDYCVQERGAFVDVRGALTRLKENGGVPRASPADHQ